MEKFKIAVANTRKATDWKNIDLTLSAFIERLKSPTETSETQGEYKNLTKSQQDEIKDVGGYICGYLKEGRRTSSSLQYRSMITLDADFATDTFLADIELKTNFNYILHSTRKHEEEKPRYRLIIPLSRNVKPDEYEAVARYIANDIGIELFDDTTYQPSRFMFYPSISRGQEYVFKAEISKDFLNPDEILEKYDNWQDRSAWAVSARAGKIISKEIKKQKNPLEKQGVVGAFCKVYDVEKGIDTFLSDVYEKCDLSNRYTFLNGSTYGGAVVYENGNFLYSNHATDPICGRLCNSFDLVRIHKFGDLDEDIDFNTPVAKRSSYTKMLELAREDKAVKRLIQEERQAQALKDFEGLAELIDEEEKPNNSWFEKLEMDKKGKVISSRDNALLILMNDPRLKDRLGMNEFTGKPMVLKPLYWKKEIGEWEDSDSAILRHYFEKYYNFNGDKKLSDAWVQVLIKNKYHPVRDYLKSLKWDGIERMETFLMDFLGAEDNEYVRKVSRVTLIGAVARVFEPGCKLDTATIFIGGQGKGKSELIYRLAVNWGSEELQTIHGKEAFEQLQGKWIIELAELTALKKADVNKIKSFISKRADNYRAAFGMFSKDRPRQCIFIGTTNDFACLKDATGDRRFYPVDLDADKHKKDVYKDFTKQVVNQLWAEAYISYKAGEEWHISDKKLLALAEFEQKAHRDDHPYQGVIEGYLETLLPENWKDFDIYKRRQFFRGGIPELECIVKRDKVCIPEIWCEALGGEVKELDRGKSNAIRDCIIATGKWSPHKSTMRRDFYGTHKGFVRKHI